MIWILLLILWNANFHASLLKYVWVGSVCTWTLGALRFHANPIRNALEVGASSMLSLRLWDARDLGVISTSPSILKFQWSTLPSTLWSIPWFPKSFSQAKPPTDCTQSISLISLHIIVSTLIYSILFDLIGYKFIQSYLSKGQCIIWYLSFMPQNSGEESQHYSLSGSLCFC